MNIDRYGGGRGGKLGGKYGGQEGGFSGGRPGGGVSQTSLVVLTVI
jgi:hypothetical protein